VVVILHHQMFLIYFYEENPRMKAKTTSIEQLMFFVGICTSVKQVAQISALVKKNFFVPAIYYIFIHPSNIAPSILRPSVRV